MLEERPARKPFPHLQGRGRDSITSLADELLERATNSARHAPEASQQKVASNDTQPRTIIVTIYPQGSNRYSAWFDGEEIISGSRDPEHDIARALLAKGIAGRALIVDGHTGARRSWVNIEKAAPLRMVEESRGGLRRRKWSEYTGVGQKDDSGVEDDLAECNSTSPEEAAYAVRESHEQARTSIPYQGPASPAAHPPDRLLIQLTTEWRVVDDNFQYILQLRKGNARSKASGWVARAFCRKREALLRCIRENGGPVDNGALKRVEALPEWQGGAG